MSRYKFIACRAKRRCHRREERQERMAGQTGRRTGKPWSYSGYLRCREREEEFSDSSGAMEPVSKRSNAGRQRMPPIHDDRAKISCNFLDERSRACSRNLSIGCRCIVCIILCEQAHVDTCQRCVLVCKVGDRGKRGMSYTREREREGVTGRDAKGTIREIVGRLSLLFEDNNGSIRNPGRGHTACRWIAGNARDLPDCQPTLKRINVVTLLIDSMNRKAACSRKSRTCQFINGGTG